MKRAHAFAARLLATLLLISGAEVALSAPAADAADKEKAALEAGVRAVIYGLPLVIMDLTMRSATGVGSAQGAAAPVNQFAHMRRFPTADFKLVVRANVDTLYSSAFLDLSGEPLVLSLPDTHGRYYLMPMMDAWTNVFASPGARTTGTQARRFAITGPGWSGTLPEGVERLASPTNMVWILGRTQTNGPSDYEAVHALQDGYLLVPLSAYGKAYSPPRAPPTAGAPAAKTPPVEQLEHMSATEYFNALARLLKINPPPAAEAPLLARLAQIGIVPGARFDLATLDPKVAAGLGKSVQVALAQLRQRAEGAGKGINGWRIPPMNLGNYGSDYGPRAVIALIAFGANLPADAIYPTTFVDGDGRQLNGASRYLLHFDKGQSPPVRAFWSVTMYDPQSFFVANPINRYAVSSWMPLTPNADGSLDIYVQHDPPGKDREANWLPAAAGDFNITLRMYWPREQGPSIIDGSWQPPPVRRLP
jgi:hypothetical protein